MAATVRIGTCSWADEALSKYFYPPKLPAKERLAWYAEHFDTVEVDSTFYRLPSESMVQGWAERTPDDFTMHIKAFGLMTRHPVKAEVVPEDLREEMPMDERGRVDRPPRELRGEILTFLERIGAGYVVVDAPRSDTARNLVPTVLATTSPTAYVRFHGRNLGTWNKRG